MKIIYNHLLDKFSSEGLKGVKVVTWGWFSGGSGSGDINCFTKEVSSSILVSRALLEEET